MASICAIGSTTGSIIAEWNACEVTSLRAATPDAISSCSSRDTASAGPDATHRPGAFSAAIATSSGNLGVRSAADRRTDSMLPAGSACMRRPRSRTSASASSSRITPASAAQTNSPTLCPINAPGSTPQLIHSRASEYSRQKIAGCVTLVGTSTVGSSEKNLPRGSSPVRRWMISQHSSYASRNAGSDACRPRPIAAYCEPWPGQRNATSGRSAGSSRDPVRAASGDRSSSAACACDVATTQRRWPNARRPTRNVCATSASSSGDAPFAAADARCSASCAAVCASASAERAETSSSWFARVEGAVAARSGASSSTTCAFVPPNPNELTAARRGASPRRHCVSFSCTWNGVRPKSICGFGFSYPIDGGNASRCSDSDALIRLAAPAAMTMCPTLLFSEPTAQKPQSSVWRRNARVSPSISIGSPSGVAVPCAST